MLETIEPRILFSADFAPGLLDAAPFASEAEQRSIDDGGEFVHDFASDAQLTRREIVFVDAATPDYDKLIEQIRGQGGEREFEMVLLDVSRDGIEQISETLAGRGDIGSVHLISHGSDGAVQLGSSTLDFDSLLKNATQIKSWAEALTADADLLIYGCDVAGSEEGRSLIDALARLTGADVAASDDLTGAVEFGGDWILEYRTGEVDTDVVVSISAQLDWRGTLGEVQLYYGEGASATPVTRDYTDATNTWTVEDATVSAGSTVRWSVAEKDPTSREEIIAVLSDNGATTELDVMRWNGSSYVVDWTATTITTANDDKRGFDVAYEQSSGDAMVVYANGTNLEYRVWNGTAWTAPANVFATPPTTGTVLWAELASRPGSDQIALVYSDSNRDLGAVIWDGTSWQEATTERLLETALPLTSSGAQGQYRSFDVAYEQSGDLLVAWGRAGNVGYATYSAAGVWNTAFAPIALVAGNNTIVDLAAEPGGNRIALAVIAENGGNGRLGLGTWNGAAWVNTGQFDSGLNHIPSADTGGFWAGAGWVGTTGRAVAVYSDSNTGQINYATWTAAGGWVVQVDVAVPGSTARMRSVQLESYVDQNKLMAVYSDTSGDLWAATYNGTSWTVTNAGSALELGLSDARTVPFDFTVAAANGPPVANADSYSVNEDATLAVSDASWWNTSWQRRRQITIDNLGRTALTDFPILVALDGSKIDYAQTQNAGQDLRFVDANGTLLAHEIESWNESGTSYVWVRVPQVDANSNVDYITMYYGNAVAADGQNADAVWNPAYVGVWHMTGGVQDSSGTGNNGTNSGTVAIAGRIGDARDFDGNNDYVSVTNNATLQLTSTMTLEGWIRLDSFGAGSDVSILIRKGDDNPNNYQFSIGNQTPYFTINDGESTGLLSPSNLGASQWYHLSATFDGATRRMYINGVQVASDSFATPAGTDTRNLYIGGRTGSTDVTNGRLDEIRVSNVAHSADWIAAQYANVTSAGFLTFGAEQATPGLLANDTDPNGDLMTTVLVAGPTNAAAFVLNANGSFTYTPTADFHGVDTFTYRASDGAAPLSGITTVTITVNPINDAPVASGSATLAAVAEDTLNPAGATVSVLFAGNYSDAIDGTAATALSGIAITANAATAGQGSWQYSSDGSSWNSVPTAGLGDTTALVLPSSYYLRFVPAANYNGTPGTLTARLADGSTGATAFSASSNISAGIGGTGKWSTATVALGTTIAPVNDAPIITSNGGGASAGISMAENSTAVTTVAASDVDVGDILTYSIVGGADQALFAIDSGTGVLTFMVAPNRESPTDAGADNVYDVTVQVFDGTANDTQAIAVSITDVDESDVGAVSDTDLAVNGVAENAANGTVVGVTAFASDADATNNAITYSLDDSAGGRFAIGGGSGVVTVADGSLLDREAAASHSITVRATSQDGSFSTQVLSIAVADIDEFDVGAIADIDPTADAVNENVAIGAVVGVTASATDADATNNTISYSLTDDAGGLFAIDSVSGVVTVAGALDAESAASQSITVQAVSSDGSVSSASFMIAVNDVNEFAVGPVTDVDGVVNELDEDEPPGTSVGITAEALDLDATTSAITYSLDDDAGGLFAIDPVTGDVSLLGALDREAAANHSITVRATSLDGSFSTQAFSIAVNDVDEFDVGAISDTDAAADNVAENAANGTLVGVTAFASDADATSNAIIYSLDDSAGGRFSINGTTGVVSVAGAINREAAASHNITVRATSLDGSFSTQVFSIAVTDVDEFNIGAISDTDVTADSVAENAANGTVVGITALASDADATTNVITDSLDDDAGGRFAIGAATGVVTIADGSLLDREAAASHSITVRATSADGSSSTQAFSIALTDVNEFAVGAIADTDALANGAAENSPAGTPVGITAFASDADATTNAVAYSLDDDAGGRFAVDAATGVVRVAGVLDYEVAVSHNIIARATSADGSFSTQTLTVNVSDGNEVPVFNDQGFAVAENSSNGSVVGALAIADPDVGDTASYTILAGNAGGAFTVDALGQVVVANSAMLDFEITPSFTLMIQVQDSGGLTDTANVTVNLTGVNEAPVLVSNSLSISQGAAVTLSAVNLSAIDVDSAFGALTFNVSNVTNGRFERVTAPGVAVTSFTQAEVLGAQVRFVHSGAASAPGYDLLVGDGTLTIGPFSASVSFNPAPVIVTTPPSSVPPPAPPPFAIGPLPAPVPAPTVAPAFDEPGDALIDAGFSPGRAPVDFSDLSEMAVRLAEAEARVPLKVAQPESNPNKYELRPSVEPQVALFSMESAELALAPSAPVEWTVAPAFSESAEEQIRGEVEVLFDSVKFGGMALSVGIVWWASRISGLLGTLLASTPAWRHIDPLPVLARDDEKEDKKWYEPDRDADANELAVSLVLEGSHRAARSE
ncbi:MAG TPA: DUF2341 domain-containing protein [Burkholderiales bacterium]